MTTDDRFGTSLSSWLREDAAHRVPDHLAETLVQTAATRQRPWWSSLEGLFPMMTTARTGAPTRGPLLAFAILSLLLLAIVGATLLAGVFQPPTVPIGPASNGRIVVADGSGLYTYAADGTDRRELASLAAGTSAYALSPDGTHLAMKVEASPPRIRLVAIADGSATEFEVAGADAVPDYPLSWSPDNRQLTFAGLRGEREQLFVLDTARGTTAMPVRAALDALDASVAVVNPAYSPDGQWIAFAARNTVTSYGRLYVVRPDGTGMRELDVPSVAEGGGPVWSPERGTRRIAYETFSGGALQSRMFDLDTDVDRPVSPGFWPSWSPDGSRIALCCAHVVETSDVLNGRPKPTTIFEQGLGYCPDEVARTGRAACSAVVWSPDGQWVIAADVAQRDLLLAPADDSAAPRRLVLTSGREIGGEFLPVAWQPVWP